MPDESRQLPDAASTSVRPIEGSHGTGAVVRTLTHAGFKPLNDHLVSLGYGRIDEKAQAVAMTAPNWDSVQVVVPFEKDENRYASILHGSTPRERSVSPHARDDLVAVEIDVTRLRSLSEKDMEKTRSEATKPNGKYDLSVLRKGGLIPEGRTWIFKDGQVVEGHACDFGGCWWPDVYWCCGPSAVACLATGPLWYGCLVATCGSCCVLASIWCGCW